MSHTTSVPCTIGACALTIFPGCVSKPPSFKLTCLLANVLLLTLHLQPKASALSYSIENIWNNVHKNCSTTR